jgi:hypothetical protein
VRRSSSCTSWASWINHQEIVKQLALYPHVVVLQVLHRAERFSHLQGWTKPARDDSNPWSGIVRILLDSFRGSRSRGWRRSGV